MAPTGLPEGRWGRATTNSVLLPHGGTAREARHQPDAAACAATWPDRLVPDHCGRHSRRKLGVSTGIGKHPGGKPARRVLDERQLEAGSVLAVQRLEQHVPDGGLQVLRHEVRDQGLADGHVASELRQLGELQVPLRDMAVDVDAEDGRVRRLNDPPEVISDAERLRSSRKRRGNSELLL